MRESNFIEQNRKKWEEFERMLSDKDENPDKLSDLFVQITDDLSYARTFYPNRSVRYYLNSLAQQIFYKINSTRKNRFKSFKDFWTFQVPRVVYDSRKELFLSLIIFVVAMIIGVFSSIQEPDFAKSILGDNYVSMTVENINSGDPMAVYKKSGEFDMFLGISINNLMVAFRTFVMGILLSVGTILIMVYNGIMVGVFQYFFIEKGLFWESFLTIWLHGTLEISSIVIAGGAGLKLGSGLIFPGTYSRMQAFKISGKKGLIIMMSLVPVFIFAALIESFVTRYTEMHFLVKGSLILVSFAFIVSYFIVLPYLKARRGDFDNLPEEKIASVPKPTINLFAINSPGEIFSQNFILYKKFFSKILLGAVLVSVLYTIPIFFVLNESLSIFSEDTNYFFVFRLFDYSGKYGGYLATANLLMMGLNIFFINLLFKKFMNPQKVGNAYFLWFLSAMIVSSLIQMAMYLHPSLILINVILILPLLLLWCSVVVNENSPFLNSFQRTINLASAGYGRLLTLTIVLVIASIIYFFLIESPFTYVYFQAIHWNLNLTELEGRHLQILFSTFISVLALNLIIPLSVFGFNLSHFTLREILEAGSLKEKISNFGSK